MTQATRPRSPPPTPTRCLFLDCDDCLYQNEWKTEKRITASINQYLPKLGVAPDRAFSLYQQYGTTLKGLMAEGHLNAAGAEAFLVNAHSIDYCDIQADPALADVLSKLRTPSWIFTAGTSEHAERCLAHLGLDGLRRYIEGIIDVRSCKFESKHSETSFAAALRAAREHDPSLKPEECCLCDDSVRNITRAKAMGWRTVLVGDTERATGLPRTCDAADFVIPSLHSLPSVMPQLFLEEVVEEEPEAPATQPSSKRMRTAVVEREKSPESVEDEIIVHGVERRGSIEM